MDVIQEANSDNEKNQEKVPVEIESVNSEGGNINHNIKALPNSSIIKDLMTKILGRIMSSANSLTIKSFPSGASILRVAINNLGGDKLRIRDIGYELTPEIYKASSYTGFTGKRTKNENDILKMNNILRDLGYTGVGHKKLNRKTFFTITLPELFDEIQNKTFDEITDDSDYLQGEGVEIFIPSNIIDIYTRLELLLGLKISGHAETLTEASKLINEMYKRGGIQKKQQYRNALNNFST